MKKNVILISLLILTSCNGSYISKEEAFNYINNSSSTLPIDANDSINAYKTTFKSSKNDDDLLTFTFEYDCINKTLSFEISKFEEDKIRELQIHMYQEENYGYYFLNYEGKKEYMQCYSSYNSYIHDIYSFVNEYTVSFNEEILRSIYTDNYLGTYYLNNDSLTLSLNATIDNAKISIDSEYKNYNLSYFKTTSKNEISLTREYTFNKINNVNKNTKLLNEYAFNSGYLKTIHEFMAGIDKDA